jgi:hypothetical protein
VQPHQGLKVLSVQLIFVFAPTVTPRP